MEQLEQRLVLSIAVPVLPTADVLASLAGELIDIALDAIPDDVRDQLPPRFERDLRALDSSFIYQAFPGEVNDVRVYSQLANSLLMLNDSSDVTMIRIPPGISPEVIKGLKFTFTAKGEGGGSFVAHLAGGIGINFEGLLDAGIKNLIQLPKADVIVPNGLSLVDLIPGLNDLVDSFNAILDFDVADYFQDDVLVIPPWYVPKWVPLIGGVKIFPGFKIPVPDFVDDFLTIAPTSLRDIIDLLPDEVDKIVSAVESVLDVIQGTISTSGITVSALDGNDTVNFSALTGIPQFVLAGLGNDTIYMGGGQNILSSWGISFYDNVDDKTIELYGEEGNDTFVINRFFNSHDTIIDGGEGSDRLLIQSTPFADVIRLIAGPDGTLSEIRFEAANPNPGLLADEVQIVALPDDVVGGTFTLAADGLGETAPIAWNASAADVKAALVAIGIASPDLTVTGSAGGPWTVTFTGSLGSTDLPMLTGDGTDLQRIDPPITISTIQEADDTEGTDEVQRILLPAETTGGTFKLRLDSVHGWTMPIQHDAGTADVKAALLATALELTDADLEVTGAAPIWYVKFTGALGASDQPMLETDGLGLSGGLEVDVAETAAPVPGVNQQQTVSIFDATGGTFRLGFTRDSTTRWTGDLSYDALAIELQNELEELSIIGEDNVQVSGPSGGPWVVEFIGDLTEENQALLQVDDTNLIDVSSTDVAQTQAAVATTNQVQTVTVPAEAAGGTFELWFVQGSDAASTGELSYVATAAEVQAALESIPDIGAGNVVVTGPDGGPWDVEFVGDWGGQSAPLLIADASMLRGGLGDDISVEELTAGSPVNEIQRVLLPGTANGGTFTLSFDGHTTAPIAYNADGAAVEAALVAAGISADDIDVSGEAGGPWDIEFTGSREGQDQPDVTGDASLVLYTGGNLDITEDTKGNDGAETVVLSKTVFTELVNVESLQIQGGDGSDTLIIDNTEGPIYFSEGIHWSGGSGLNKLILVQDDGAIPEAASSEHTGSKVATTFGLGAADEQLVLYSSSRVYDFVNGGELIVKASVNDDTIEIGGDDYEGEAVGLIRVSNGPSRLYYKNKDSLVVLAREGDDSITLHAGALPAGITAVTIDGESSTGGDALLINGTDLDDVFDFTPTSMKGGTLALNVGGASIAVELAGIESLDFDALEQGAADTLAVNAPQADVVPGDYPGTGEVTARSAAGLPRLSVEYVNMENVNFNALDVVAFDGSAGDDVVTVTPSQVIFIDIFGHANATDVAGTDVVWLHLMDGNDEVTVLASEPLPFQLEILGGGSDPGGDVLVFAGAGGALTVRLDDMSLTETGGSRVTYYGLETFDLNTVGGPLAVAATSDDETLKVTPLTGDAGRLAFEDSYLRFRYAGLLGQPATVDLAGGEDVLVVEASAADDTVVLDRLGIHFTDDGRRLAYTGVEALTIMGLQGDDQLTLDNAAGLIDLPGDVYYDGGPGSDTLILTGPLPVDTVLYEVGPGPSDGRVTHTAGEAVQTAYFTDLEPVIDLVEGTLVIRGTNASDLITLDVGPNSGLLPGGVQTAIVAVSNYETIEFGNKTAVTIEALAGHDTVDLNNAPLPIGLPGVTVEAGSGNDIVIGSAGDDTLIGGRGDDLLRGEDGNDTLLGGEGDDDLRGGAGDDFLDAGTGDNAMDGGAGTDTGNFGLTDGDDSAEISPQAVVANGETTLISNLEILQLDAMAGNDTVEIDASAGSVPTMNIQGGHGDDVLNVTIANPAPFTWITLDGGDHLFGDSATVLGLFGDDQFTAHGDFNVFGQTTVVLTNIENPLVLESRRIDGSSRTSAARRWLFTDADGNDTLVSVRGPGVVDVFRNLYNGRNADIYSMDMVSTSRWKTGLTVAVRRKAGTDNETSIGSVTGTGVRSFIATRSDLTRDMTLSEGIRVIRLDDIRDGVEIYLGGMSNDRLFLRADKVGDVDLTTDAYVQGLIVGNWDAGTIQGAVFKTVQTRNGRFGADLINTRMNYGQYGIYNVLVRGGDLIANMTADRIRNVRVINGNAAVNITVTSDPETLRGRPALGQLSVVGGDLLGATINNLPGTLVGKLLVRGRRGVGGNVTGPVIITGNLGNTSVSGDVNATVIVGGSAGKTTIRGDLVTGGWTVGGSMGNFIVRGTATAASPVSAIRSGGSMGKLIFGAIEHVDVLAGISLMAGRFADEPGDFANPDAMIASVLIKGLRVPKGTPMPRFMTDSYFSAAAVGVFRVINADAGTTGLYVTAAGDARKVIHVDKVDKTQSFVYPPKPGEVFAPPFPFFNAV